MAENSIRARFSLAGRVAIVTGGSAGIGAAIAAGLAEFGATVVVSSRKQAAVDAVAARINEAGGTARAIAAHVGDSAALAQLVNVTLADFGRLDIVVNNAAVSPYFGPLSGADRAAFEKTLAVNVLGPFELCRIAYPALAERPGSSIINIASVGGLRPEPMLGMYSVSKAALISLTQVLAQEWAECGVRVNAICPGLVQTRFSAALWQNEALLEQVLRRVPLKRIAQPEEIVPLAVFLASDAASYCTGGVYTVDGGHTI